MSAKQRNQNPDLDESAAKHCNWNTSSYSYRYLYNTMETYNKYSLRLGTKSSMENTSSYSYCYLYNTMKTYKKYSLRLGTKSSKSSMENTTSYSYRYIYNEDIQYSFLYNEHIFILDLSSGRFKKIAPLVSMEVDPAGTIKQLHEHCKIYIPH